MASDQSGRIWKLLFVSTCLLSSVHVSNSLAFSKATFSRRDAIAVTSSTLLLPVQKATAAETQQLPALSAPKLLGTLRSIPVFTIVSADGTPYMLYNPDTDSAAKGYAFVTYDGALAVLQDAKASATKTTAGMWENAGITAISAEVAIKLTLQPARRTSQKGQIVNSLLEIVPGADERDDGKKMNDIFKQQDKVPLFYSKALLYNDVNGEPTLPMYFNKDDLLAAWILTNGPDKPIPSSNVIELGALFQYVLRGRADELPFGTNQNVVFVPTSQALDALKTLKDKGLLPYKFDKMIV
jgi:hypothetical protein